MAKTSQDSKIIAILRSWEVNFAHLIQALQVIVAFVENLEVAQEEIKSFLDLVRFQHIPNRHVAVLFQRFLPVVTRFIECWHLQLGAEFALQHSSWSPRHPLVDCL